MGERTEKLIEKNSDQQQKEFLVKKKSRLISQLEEAKTLKGFRDRRGEHVSKVIRSLLPENFLQEFSDFLSKKTDLINELKQLEDRIETGEDQLKALSGAC